MKIDHVDFDLAPLNKWSSCLIGIADISMVSNHTDKLNINVSKIVFMKEKSLQKLMFPSNRRQLILINTNATKEDLPIKVDTFHHPIAIFRKRNENIMHNLACRNGKGHVTNIYSAKRKLWDLPFDVDPLSGERFENSF